MNQSGLNMVAVAYADQSGGANVPGVWTFANAGDITQGGTPKNPITIVAACLDVRADALLTPAQYETLRDILSGTLLRLNVSNTPINIGTANILYAMAAPAVAYYAAVASDVTYPQANGSSVLKALEAPIEVPAGETVSVESARILGTTALTGVALSWRLTLTGLRANSPGAAAPATTGYC